MSNPYSYPYNRAINQQIMDDYYWNPITDGPDNLAGLSMPKNGMPNKMYIESHPIGRLENEIPEPRGRKKGGSKYRSTKSNYITIPEGEYYQPGNIPVAPYLNMSENIKMNQMDNPYEFMQGSGKPKRAKRATKKGGKSLDPPSKPQYQSQTQQVAVPQPKKKGIPGHILSTALDFTPTVLGALPLLAGPKGAIAAPIVKLAADKARNLIKEKTGYGHPDFIEERHLAARPLGDVEKIEATKKKRGRKPKASSSPKEKPTESIKSRRETRTDLVRQIMKEKHMSLPQASRYIKENKLY